MILLNLEQAEWLQGSTVGLRNTKTDYARQHQLDLLAGYKIIDKENQLSLWMYGGVFASMIDHFHIIDIFQAHELNTTIYVGSLNAVIYSDQRFYTIGGQLELAGEWKRKNTFFAPFIKAGIGPNHTSFGSLGIRVTGVIRK